MNNSISLYKKTKRTLTDLIPEFVFVLLLAQPVLDVISYWATEWELTAYTTALRFLMFAGVMLYAYIVSDRKAMYFLFGGVMALYWIFHMVACLRSAGGYASPLSDFSNYLRTIQMPLFALCFMTFFKKSDLIPGKVQCAFFINMVIMIHSIIFSYMTGTQVYTYIDTNAGLMGWASVHNAQSAIVAIVIPLLLLYVYRKKNKFLFYTVSVVCFGLLYFTGTRVDYLAIFVIAPAMMILLLIQGERSPFYYVLLACVIVLSAACYSSSVVNRNYSTHEISMGIKQDYVNNFVNNSSSSSNQVPYKERKLPATLDRESYEALDDQLKEKVAEIYDLYLYPMVERFGLERVLEKYDYSLNVTELTASRQQKRFFAQLAWEDSDFFTRCFGYEYSTLIAHYTVEDEKGEMQELETIYDLENDFPSVFYFSGYIGFAVYMLFLAYFAALIVVAVITRFKKVMNLECGLVAITFALVMGASQFSGNVLRRPNASIYLSVILAYIYYLTVVKEDMRLRDLFCRRKKKNKKTAALEENSGIAE